MRLRYLIIKDSFSVAQQWDQFENALCVYFCILTIIIRHQFHYLFKSLAAMF